MNLSIVAMLFHETQIKLLHLTDETCILPNTKPPQN